MKNFLLILVLTLATTSCSNISNNNANNLIARAGENFLYTNDIPKYLSEEDSIKRISSFIESWAKEKILYDLSLVNLSQQKKN